jgi:hypothetical protein
MSHVVAIDLQIKSLDAVKRTCAELGLSFKENQKTFAWWGRWVNDYAAKDAAYRLGIDPKDYGKCDHAIGVPGSTWEIGLCKNPKGEGHLLAFDFYGAQGKAISNAVGGNEGDKFRQLYTANATELEMAAAGYNTAREWQDDGSLNVVVTQGY